MHSAVLATVNLSLSVTHWHCVNMTRAMIMGSSLQDSPITHG